MIYQPAEDSYLLQETIKDFLKDKNKNIKILDMGSGSGIQAETCLNLDFKNIFCADIDPEVIRYLKEKGLNIIKSNLFSNISKKFDLIIFNAPYLPEDEREPEDIKLATTAGKKGYEIIIKFLEEAKEYLNDNGKILLLFSSFSQPNVILKKANEFRYRYKLINNIKLDFEELFVYEFK